MVRISKSTSAISFRWTDEGSIRS